MRIAKTIEPLRAVVSLFYPALCVVCSEPVEHGEQICPGCFEKAPRIVAPFCAKCSEPFTGAIDQEFTCANCANRELEFDAAVSVYRSRGVVRLVIMQLKYQRHLSLRHPAARWLIDAMHDSRIRERKFDAIIPVPLHPARLRERGFNQATLLAAELGAAIGVPLRDDLERIRYTTTQTALDRSERMENLRDAFRLRREASVRDSRVLLVDDILTTGSTLSECARVLRKGGTREVYAVTAARA